MHRIDEISYSLAPIAIVTGVCATLIFFEPDLGTAVTLVFIAGVMVFAAGLHYGYVIGALVAAMPALYFLAMAAGYRASRLAVFWDPWPARYGDGYQIVQSLIAVGTGGVFGRGLTRGVRKLFYLPEAHTDFIFSVIAEELGLIGAAGILACFAVIAWRGFRIAAQAEDPFGSLVALGITTMLSVQAFINMSVVLGLVPNKGISLPLVSFGGSSLLVSLLGVGVLLNISQHTAEAR
jgi:cell division protein FtsW